MYSHEIQLRVRYGETDKMGYLYYGNYAQYFEVGRVEWLRSLGFSYRAMEDEMGILMPVKRLDIRYVRPLHYDELVTVKTTLRQLPDNYITFDVELFTEKGKLATGGKVKLVFVQEGKTIPFPNFLKEKISPYFEKTES